MSERFAGLEAITLDALVGHTITDVQVNEGNDEILFTIAPHPDIPDGLTLKMFHYQDCCEHVTIEDVTGDWSDIIGSPITMAEAVTQTDADGAKPKMDPEWPEFVDDYFTWTFYKMATVKGYVTIRWYGTSNGYYSEAVSLARANA